MCWLIYCWLVIYVLLGTLGDRCVIWLSDWLVHWLANVPTNVPITGTNQSLIKQQWGCWLIHSLAGLLVGWCVDWYVSWSVVWLVGWLTGWFTYCVVGWYVVWLVGPLVSTLVDWWADWLVHSLVDVLVATLGDVLTCCLVGWHLFGQKDWQTFSSSKVTFASEREIVHVFGFSEIISVLQGYVSPL